MPLRRAFVLITLLSCMLVGCVPFSLPSTEPLFSSSQYVRPIPAGRYVIDVEGRRIEFDVSFRENTLHITYSSKKDKQIEWVGGFIPLATSLYFIVELTEHYESGKRIGNNQAAGHLPVKIEGNKVTLIGGPKIGHCNSECETFLTSHGFQRQGPFTGAMYTPEWAFPGATTKPQLTDFYSALAEWFVNGQGNWQTYDAAYAGG